MPEEAEVRVHRARPGDDDEVARFAEAFDDDVLADETRRFLADARHHLVLGYVHDRPAGFVSGSKSSTRTSGANSS